MEEVLFETESRQDKTEVATYLRTVADRIEAGKPLVLSAGDQSVELPVPNRPTFEVKAERESDGGGSELSVEFEIEWPEGQASTDEAELSIE